MRPNSRRAKLAIVSLYFIIATSVLFACSMASELYLINRALNGRFLTQANAHLYTLHRDVVVILYFASYLLCAVFFILWFTRAYRNIQLLLPKSKFHYKPWAAAVTWFIPIWNLFGPYNIATNLFDKTERYLVNEERMDLRPKYDIVKGWWWALWIMSSVVLRMSEHFSTGNPNSLIGPSATFVGFLISILCAANAVKMIKNYTELEVLILSPDGNSIDYKVSNDDLLDSGI